MIDGRPAIQQTIEGTRPGEESWKLATTVRGPSRGVLVTAYADSPGRDTEAVLIASVASLRLLG